jgi:hypothetical protein
MALGLRHILIVLGLVGSTVRPTIAMYDCSVGTKGTALTKKIPYKGCFHDGQGGFAESVNETHPYVFPTFHACYYDIYLYMQRS